MSCKLRLQLKNLGEDTLQPVILSEIRLWPENFLVVQ